MEAVIVDKGDLLVALKENRKKHREVFEKALIGYREEAIRLLDKALKDAKAGRKVNTWIQLQEPVDQTKDYDRAIKMIEMSVDTKIEISEHDFQCYALDDWVWKKQFTATNAMYLAKKAQKGEQL